MLFSAPATIAGVFEKPISISFYKEWHPLRRARIENVCYSYVYHTLRFLHLYLTVFWIILYWNKKSTTKLTCSLIISRLGRVRCELLLGYPDWKLRLAEPYVAYKWNLKLGVNLFWMNNMKNWEQQRDIYMRWVFVRYYAEKSTSAYQTGACSAGQILKFLKFFP